MGISIITSRLIICNDYCHASLVPGISVGCLLFFFFQVSLSQLQKDFVSRTCTGEKCKAIIYLLTLTKNS